MPEIFYHMVMFFAIALPVVWGVSQYLERRRKRRPPRHVMRHEADAYVARKIEELRYEDNEWKLVTWLRWVMRSRSYARSAWEKVPDFVEVIRKLEDHKAIAEAIVAIAPWLQDKEALICARLIVDRVMEVDRDVARRAIRAILRSVELSEETRNIVRSYL